MRLLGLTVQAPAQNDDAMPLDPLAKDSVSGSAPADGRVVLITGANAGIGRALTEELLRRGDVVYAGFRDQKRADESFAPLGAEFGERLRAIKLDVTQTRDVNDAVARILKECGRIDVLVNNAGYGAYGAFEELEAEKMRAQFETNYFGALALVRAVLPSMRERGKGYIYNITSILGRIAIPTGTAYVSSKWALDGFSETLRLEMFPFGIRVCAIQPGLIKTNFKDNMILSSVLETGKTDSPYQPLNNLIGGDYEGIATSAAACARRIARIMKKKNPAARYTVGVDAFFARRARRMLPERFYDWMVRLYIRGVFRKKPSKKPAQKPEKNPARNP